MKQKSNVKLKSSALWLWTLVDGNEDYVRLSLSLCCLLGAVWCGNLPTWLEEAVRKLELEDATIKAVRRTWIRIYYCGLLPVFQIGCAFLTFQESGSSQTAIIQDLCVAVVIVSSLLYQTDQNILRIRRGVLLIGWPIFCDTGTIFSGTSATGDVWLLEVARWHACSAVIYNSLIDHLQDSLFILAGVLAAHPWGLIKIAYVVGITITSSLVICVKTSWCQSKLQKQHLVLNRSNNSVCQ